MNKSEKIKRYQKQKFENYKKINGLRIRDNEAYIDLKIKDLESLKNEFSPDKKTILREEFYDYIERHASYIPLDYPLVLEIHYNSLNSEEKILLRRLIKSHFSLEMVSKEMELNAIKRKTRFFLISGIISFIALYFCYNYNFIPYVDEIVSFIASFNIWEYAELLIFEQDELNEEYILKKHLSKIRVVYNKT